MRKAGEEGMGQCEEARFMQAIILRLCLLLWIAVLVSNIGGCHKDNQSEIADIAKKEAIQREAWAGQLEVDVSKTKEGWEAWVWRMPKTPGGFVVVEISFDKKVIEYRKGK